MNCLGEEVPNQDGRQRRSCGSVAECTERQDDTPCHKIRQWRAEERKRGRLHKEEQTELERHPDPWQ